MSLSTHIKRRKRTCSMENFPNVLVNASEFMKGRLYFVSLSTEVKPKSTSTVHYFSIDSEFRYENFYKDFGPLNLSVLYHYCTKMQKKLSSVSFQNKKIVHYTGPDDEKRVNAAYLIGCYAIIYLKFEPNQAHDILMKESKKSYLQFRDASWGEAYNLSLLDCLKAVKKAHDLNFFDFNNFDHVEYEHYERVEHGDLNWIVPNKFIAFCGPHNKAKIDNGYYIHAPETYFGYFRRSGVSTIVRLNYEVYEANKFVMAGFDHMDLYFVDGGTPNDKIMDIFLKISEEAKGAIAVHCKAGLGRTGTLIACYIIKHYKFSSDEAIAWIRICRPGSVIGHQQSWLRTKEQQLWSSGEAFKKMKGIKSITKHAVGIYPLRKHEKKKHNDNVNGILKKVDSMGITDRNDNYTYEEKDKGTQGDKLNEIKAQRVKNKAIITNMNEPQLFRTKIHVNGFSNGRSNEIMTTSQKVAHTSRHVLAKRNEVTEGSTRRTSQRKLVATLTSTPTDKKKTTATVRVQKKKENVISWLPTSRKTGVEDIEAKGSTKTVRRVKRTLRLEPNKVSPRSVKVLRRSHGVTLSETLIDVKLCLPAVRLNKTL